VPPSPTVANVVRVDSPNKRATPSSAVPGRSFSLRAGVSESELIFVLENAFDQWRRVWFVTPRVSLTRVAMRSVEARGVPSRKPRARDGGSWCPLSIVISTDAA